MPHTGTLRVDDSPENALREHFGILVESGKIYSLRDMEVRGKTAKELEYIGFLHSLLFGIVNSSTLFPPLLTGGTCQCCHGNKPVPLSQFWMCRQ